MELGNDQLATKRKRKRIISPIPGHAIGSSVPSSDRFEEYQQLNGLVLYQWRKDPLDEAPTSRYAA